MVALLHGTNPLHPIYGSWTYVKMASEQGIKVPEIHMLIENRLTQFKGFAAAFKDLSDATSTSLYEIYKKNPDYFVEAKITILSSMKQKYYTVYSEEAKVNAEKIKECTKAIDEIIVNL